MQHWKCHSEFQFCAEVDSTSEGGRGGGWRERGGWAEERRVEGGKAIETQRE